MAPSAHKICAAAHALALLLCAASTVIAAAAGDGVVTYNVPAFNATTAADFVAFTNTAFLTSTALLFDPNSPDPVFNASDGFLVLPDAVELWRRAPGGGGVPETVLEASFNTSFRVLAGAAPVSFVVLKDTYPTFNQRSGFRGAANATYAKSPGGPVPTNATAEGLAVVSVDAVRSYGPDVPTAGLNVTVTPRRAVSVWVEYRAAAAKGAHRLSVYVAGAGEARPENALLQTPLGAEGRWTTETASVGFFAGAIRDVIAGVRDWELTVDRLPDPNDGEKKGAAWWVILLAVIGSVLL